MYQKVILVGYVGRDPEFKFLSDGTAVCDFSVAVSRRWKDSAGVRQEKTTWFKVAVWRQSAETVSKFVRKGSKVLVEGSIDVDVFVTKKGEPAALLSITASDVRFLDSRSDRSDQQEDADDQVEDLLVEGSSSLPF